MPDSTSFSTLETFLFSQMEPTKALLHTFRAITGHKKKVLKQFQFNI